MHLLKEDVNLFDGKLHDDDVHLQCRYDETAAALQIKQHAPQKKKIMDVCVCASELKWKTWQ